MSAQFINFFAEAKNFLPWISFVAGVGGSLHCVGMCGGLVTATCERSTDVFRYRFGRLLGYLFLGAFAGVLGTFFNLPKLHPGMSLIPPVFVGLLFIFWGVRSLQGRKAEFPVPGIFRKAYSGLWMKLVHHNKGFSKSFFTGLISIFLPCGLVYGVALGTLALEHSYEALMSMFFFWLGTVPSMVVAPKLIQKILRPLKARLPRTYAISLLMIGIMTISFRVVKFQSHEGHAPASEKTEVHRCH